MIIRQSLDNDPYGKFYWYCVKCTMGLDLIERYSDEFFTVDHESEYKRSRFKAGDCYVVQMYCTREGGQFVLPAFSISRVWSVNQQRWL
jgi:hypothetical protein